MAAGGNRGFRGFWLLILLRQRSGVLVIAVVGVGFGVCYYFLVSWFGVVFLGLLCLADKGV